MGMRAYLCILLMAACLAVVGCASNPMSNAKYRTLEQCTSLPNPRIRLQREDGTTIAVIPRATCEALASASKKIQTQANYTLARVYLADVENKNAFATRDKQGQSIAVAANIISFAVPCIGGYLAGTVAGTGTQMAMYGAYTRPQEAEADALGLRWMYDAGYDPRGMKRVFEKLAEGSEVSTVSFLSTQPANEDRQQAVDALIAAQPSAGSRAARRETTVPITQAIGNPGWVPPSIKSCADATSETVIRAGCGIALYQVARFCK